MSDRTVLLLSSYPEIGGAERSLLGAIARLPVHGFRPVLCLPAEGAFAAEARAAGVEVEVLGVRSPNLHRLWNPLAAARRAVRAGRRHGADLVHLNSLPWLYPAVLVARRLRRPLAVHVRDHTDAAWFGARHHRWFARRVDAWLAITDFCAAPYLAAGLRPVHVLPNGVDLDAFHPGADGGEPRARWGGGPLVGLLGYLIPRKGQDLLLEAAGRLIGEGLPLRVVLAGSDPFPASGYARRLREAADRVPLAGRVVFAGFHGDAAVRLAALDVLVVASDEEPFGRVAVEAMAVGRPVVATAAGGTPEVVQDGVNGLLVPPRDPEALARALRRVLTEPGLRDRLVAEGLRTVRERYDVEVSARLLAERYRDLLATGA